jgi:hypothetical protein
MNAIDRRTVAPPVKDAALYLTRSMAIFSTGSIRIPDSKFRTTFPAGIELSAAMAEKFSIDMVITISIGKVRAQKAVDIQGKVIPVDFIAAPLIGMKK